jgi:membrane protein involved in colicin uptake
MARRSLRPHLNQIRTWVRQGRTDAWVAHQLEVTGPEIAEFKEKNGLTAASPDDPAGAVAPEDVDLRAEDDAQIAAELEAAEAERKAEAERLAAEEAAAEEQRKADAAKRAAEAAERGDGDDEGDDEDGRPRRRRRGSRRRRSGAGANAFEGTFDHGDEGYGLWLDPAVADSPVYAEHWAGHRPVEVTIEGDQIIIRRAGEGSDEN